MSFVAIPLNAISKTLYTPTTRHCQHPSIPGLMATPPTSDAIAMESPTLTGVGNAQSVPASSCQISVYCNACQTFLGNFGNEWIRVTSSYARPAQPGTHSGTDIGDKTRIAAPGATQRSAEGCTLSDVVCRKCMKRVGQYCREAPTIQQRYLEGLYLYKLSRVALKDHNLQPVDPIFAMGEESTPDDLGSPVPSLPVTDPKWSCPPPGRSHLGNVYNTHGMPPPPLRSSQTPVNGPGSQALRKATKAQWPLSQHSREASSARANSAISQTRSKQGQTSNAAETPEGLLALRRVLERDVAFEKMTIMMENMQREMREIRQSTASNRERSATVTRTQAEDEELQALRAENQALKRVLKTLPAQTQFESPLYSQSRDESMGTPDSTSLSLLGKRKRDSHPPTDTFSQQEDGIAGSYDDFGDPLNEPSGLATLERDAEQGYSVWQGEEEGSDGGQYSDENEGEDRGDENVDDSAGSGEEERPLMHAATGERQSARSRERRQTLPADFVAEEQRYLHSDSNDENFDPKDPKLKGRTHKRTRSAERRRRERVERQQDSLWKKGVPGGGYENGDGWVEQRRHHSGRFGRKTEVGGGLAVYPRNINNKLFANGRQIPTAHKRLARELVYLGLGDWIDKDKSDALYRRTVRVARKHYAYHHGGISSKALCQGKYTRKDLEAVGMWDDELYEEINLGEESDVEKLDFPLDPALKASLQKWKEEGLKAKERKKKAVQGAPTTSVVAESDDQPKSLEAAVQKDAETTKTAMESSSCDLMAATEFSDDDANPQDFGQQEPTKVTGRVDQHQKYDSIWQASCAPSDDDILSIIQHAEARIKAAEDDMGEPTFKTKKAQKFRTITQDSEASSPALSSQPNSIRVNRTTITTQPGSRTSIQGSSALRSSQPSSTYINPTTNPAQPERRISIPTTQTVPPTLRQPTPTRPMMPNDLRSSPTTNVAQGRKPAKVPSVDTFRLAAEKTFPMESLAITTIEDEVPSNAAANAANTTTSNNISPTRPVMRLVSTHLELLGLRDKKETNSFLRELRAYFTVNRETGAELTTEQHISLTDDELREYAESFLETQIVLVGGSRKIGLEFWPNNGSKALSYVTDKEMVTKHVYNLFVVQRFNKARNLVQLNKAFIDGLSVSEGRESPPANPDTITEVVPSPQPAPVHTKEPALDSRPFANGPRYPASSTFCGNGYYYKDGVPKTAEALERLELMLAGKLKIRSHKKSRQSLPNTTASHSTVSEADKTHRRATMLNPAPNSMLESNLTSNPDSSIEVSMLEHSVLQMASAMKDLTRAFHDTQQHSDGESHHLTTGLDSTQRMVADAGDDIIPVAESSGAIADTTDSSADIIEPKSLPEQRAITPPLLTRAAAARAARSAKSTENATQNTQSAQVLIVLPPGQGSPTMMSDKENTLPDIETNSSSAIEDTEPPAKKAKTMVHHPAQPQPTQKSAQNSSRPLTRKSIAELDQLAKADMERETISSARQTRGFGYFGSR